MKKDSRIDFKEEESGDGKKVILVNKFDEEIGVEEKLKAHYKGTLHRAFSVFVVNDKHELLLQRRALEKYHSAGLWSNTCCSHPAPGEELEEAAKERLMEEMGFGCELVWLFQFIYRVEFENGLVEHELDHVFIGKYNAAPKPNKLEVSEWKWQNIDFLKEDVVRNPDNYTYWFVHVFNEFYSAYKKYSFSAK